MKSAKIRALRRSILEIVDDAMQECTPLGIDYLYEVREMVDLLCAELDEDEFDELDFG